MSITYLFALLGGLVIFLYGMDLMSSGLELVAGNKLHNIIEKLTSNTGKGILVGIAVTAIIQSSSATTVMTVGFVNAGLMTLKQAVGVIMGANIGTTVTGQLVALNITATAPLLAFIGFVMYKFMNRHVIQHLGQIIMGLGLLFMGMGFMSDAMTPLQSNEAFVQLMTQISNPVTGVLVGTIFTAVIQSSSASLGILQALANKGLVGLHGSIFIICGFNIGTCITSILSALGSSKNGKRTATVHVLFNIFGTIIFLFLVYLLPIEELIVRFSKNLPAAQLANTHTLFNLITTLLLFPFSKILVNIATKLVPGVDPMVEDLSLKYINEKHANDAPILLTEIKAESKRMLDIAKENFRLTLDIFEHFDGEKYDLIQHNEEIINYLNSNITKYIIDVLSESMDDTLANLFTGYLRIVRDIERIGDHTKAIAEYAQTSKERYLTYSKAFYEEVDILNAHIKDMFDTLDVSMERVERSKTVKTMEKTIERDIDVFREHHLERMKTGVCDPESGLLYEKMLSNLDRITAYLRNIGGLIS